MNGPSCRICSNGTIVDTKVYRNSKVVVAIGYILLVLSPLGLLFAVAGLVAALKPAEGDFKTLKDLEKGLAQAGAIVIGFLSLLGALFGWLLVMKKKVLKCNQCGVEVPAP